MSLWTVISTVYRDGGLDDTRSAHPVAAVAGRVDVHGFEVHTAQVDAPDADTAMDTVRAAFRIAGSITPNSGWLPYADRWTVIGLASDGVCSVHSTVAVIAGEHTVEGRYESPLNHRWARVVDAPDAGQAEKAGWKAAADTYNDTWD